MEKRSCRGRPASLVFIWRSVAAEDGLHLLLSELTSKRESNWEISFAPAGKRYELCRSVKSSTGVGVRGRGQEREAVYTDYRELLQRYWLTYWFKQPVRNRRIREPMKLSQAGDLEAIRLTVNSIEIAGVERRFPLPWNIIGLIFRSSVQITDA